MSYEVCKKCGSLCDLSVHKCEEFEVWVAADERKWSSIQWASNAELAAEQGSEDYDSDHDWIDRPEIVCVAKPGSDEIKWFKVCAVISVDYSAEEVSE